MRLRFWLVFIAGCLFSMLCHAKVKHITVMGLFNNGAIIEIDGTRYVLRKGKTTPEGVKLISSNTTNAVIEVNGKRHNYSLGMSGAFNAETNGEEVSSDPTKSVMVMKDANGMYQVKGSINGHATTFLIDTGASAVAMNSEDADAFDIDYKKQGKVIQVHTAGGNKHAYRVKIKRLKVGDIELYNVSGVVIEGSSPAVVLLGMSVLGRLEMEHNGAVLYLRKKY